MFRKKIVLVILFLSPFLSAIRIKNCTKQFMVICPKHDNSKKLLLENNEIMHSKYLNDMIIFLYSQKTDDFFPGKKFEVPASRFHVNKRYNAYYESSLTYGNGCLRFFESVGDRSIKCDEVLLTNLQS